MLRLNDVLPNAVTPAPLCWGLEGEVQGKQYSDAYDSDAYEDDGSMPWLLNSSSEASSWRLAQPSVASNRGRRYCLCCVLRVGCVGASRRATTSRRRVRLRRSRGGPLCYGGSTRRVPANQSQVERWTHAFPDGYH